MKMKKKSWVAILTSDKIDLKRDKDGYFIKGIATRGNVMINL